MAGVLYVLPMAVGSTSSSRSHIRRKIRLRPLVESADAVVSGPCERIVKFHEEPATVDFVMNRSSQGSAVTVRLVRYADHRRHLPGDMILLLEVPALELGRSVWRALRQLESRSRATYERQWRHQFPAAMVELLGSRLV